MQTVPFALHIGNAKNSLNLSLILSFEDRLRGEVRRTWKLEIGK